VPEKSVPGIFGPNKEEEEEDEENYILSNLIIILYPSGGIRMVKSRRMR
jgi:hypothetical protein